MNEIVKRKVLLAGDKFVPEIDWKQFGFTYSVCGPFAENKERLQKFKETRDLWYIYQNELDKACFQRDMAYSDLKDLTRRTVSYKVLRHEVFNVAKNLKYDGYQMDLTLMVYKFFDKKTSGGVIKNEIMSNKELAEELQKSIIAKFKKRKVYLSFINNI